MSDTNGLSKVQIVPNEPLVTQLYRYCKEDGGIIAIHDHGSGRKLTRWQLLNQVLTLSAVILQQLPEQIRESLADRNADGDVFVCMIAQSQIDNALAFLTSYVLGVTLVLLSPNALPAEIDHFMSMSGAVAIVVDASHAAILDHVKTKDGIPRILLSFDMPPTYDLSSTNSRLDDAPPMNPEKGLILLLTSGTTGSPKGILHSRKSIVAAAHNKRWMMALSSGDVVLSSFNNAWIGGTTIFSGTILYGASLELCAEVISPEFLWDRVSAGGVDVFAGGPPFYTKTKVFIENRLKDGASEDNGRFLKGIRACRVLFTSSGYVAESLVNFWKDLHGGHPFVSAYGSTELAGGFCATDPNALDLPPFCVGRVPDNVEINLRDGEEGELRVKTEALFKRYIKSDPGPKDEGFDENGFYMTGDLFRRTGDTLFALGRVSQDVIRFNDWMVYAPAVENVLLSAPGVDTAVVFGIPDDRDGQEQLTALVSLKKDTFESHVRARQDFQPTFARNLHQYMLTEKSSPFHWLPTVVRVIGPEDEIPRGKGGKVNKPKLKEKFFDIKLEDMKNDENFQITTLAEISDYKASDPFQRWAWAAR